MLIQRFRRNIIKLLKQMKSQRKNLLQKIKVEMLTEAETRILA